MINGARMAVLAWVNTRLIKTALQLLCNITRFETASVTKKPRLEKTGSSGILLRAFRPFFSTRLPRRLGDLHRVQGSALAQVVGHAPQVNPLSIVLS